ncbi:MAG: MFS transporter, partial [Planctomycetota bacterium]|nr:MFS transporter [Planctomycetota bacterium]
PLILVMLAPFFTILWRLLDGSKRIRVNSSAKFGFGLILLGIGYAVMYVAANRTVDGAKVGPQWLMIVYLAHSMGELCLSPIGLSLVNKLSPARCASLMMAIWFLTNSVGNYLAGTLNAILRGLDMNLWLFLTIVPVGSGLILLAINPILKRMAHGHDD